MKKIIALLLLVATVLSSVCSLTGCKGEKVHIYTRSEWIGAIAEIYNMNDPSSTTPYFEDVKASDDNFNAIQACVEWDIIEKDKKFNPDKRADVDFAIVTAVKSIGIDRIAKSVNGKKLGTDKEIIDYFNENSETKYISGSSLYMDTASEILSDVSRIYGSLALEQTQNIEYTSNVVTVDDKNVQFSMDGKTATLHGITAKVGDIITIEPSELYPYGMYAKVTEVNGTEIKYTEPEFEEMFDHVVFTGTYEAKPLGFIPAYDGVTIESIGGASATTQSVYFNNGEKTTSTTMYVNSLGTRNCGVEATPIANSLDLGKIELKLRPIKGGDKDNLLNHISGKVTIKDIVATADIEIYGPVVKKADIKLDSKIILSGEFGNKNNDEKKDDAATKIPLGEVPFSLFGVIVFKLKVDLKLGINGSVSVECSFDTSAGLTYEPFKAVQYYTNAENPNLDVVLKAKAYALLDVKAVFSIACFDVANIGISGGIEASGKTKKIGTSNDVGCVDVNVFLPLEFYIGAENKETLLGKLGIKWIDEIWNASNSPLTLNLHIEDWKIVPECTKKGKETGDESGSTIEDRYTDIPGIEDVANEILQNKTGLGISTYFAAMEEKQTDKLLIEKLPDGYTASDLVFTSSNPSVATVDGNGVVSAISQGTCHVKVETKDGIYAQYCTVTVLASYYVDFTPLGYIVNQQGYIMV